MRLSTKRKLRALRDYLLDRLDEPSTYRGIVWIATGGLLKVQAGIGTDFDSMAALGMLVAGILGVLLPDRRA